MVVHESITRREGSGDSKVGEERPQTIRYTTPKTTARKAPKEARNVDHAGRPCDREDKRALGNIIKNKQKKAFLKKYIYHIVRIFIVKQKLKDIIER